jgi:Zn-dependent oligopeptidase
MNILLSPFSTEYNAVPFSKIKNEDFLPAIKNAIENAKKEIETIVNSKETPSFENTIEAIEYSGEHLSILTSTFFNLNSAETNEEIQKIAQEVSPLLSEFSNDITLNEELFKKVKHVFENSVRTNLNQEQIRLLEKRFKSFSRNGANLNEENKKKLREIDRELSTLSLKFGENILAETNNYQLHITEEKDLEGIPNNVIESAKQKAESLKKEGWIFGLDYPSYVPFVTYAKNRELRKQLVLDSGKKAYKNNNHNNEKNVLRITSLRQQRAEVLGYETHAHYILEERMAKSSSNVNTFLNDLLTKAKPAAIKQLEEVKTFAKKTDNLDSLEKWDLAYYSEKLKQERYNLDDEILKPYFKLDNVLDGVFKIASDLYDIYFEEIRNTDVYHEDVKVFKVTDKKGNYKALLYTDFFPREGKRSGAWMTSYKSQKIKNGVNERPHISIVCNFTKPTDTKPSLLTFNEVTTLFHEFGHALHGILANTTYASLSGTSVSWDFVELPSQIMENWCFEEEALKLFAKHYETGEIIPLEHIENIKNSAAFNEGIQTLRQISFGLLDMHWHGQNPTNINSVKELEKIAFKETSLFPETAETAMSTAFAHIFQGGYSAGYYSYKWSEVLDADAFEAFKENGIFDKETATKFKTYVLERGDTEAPEELYKKFRGKEASNKALLKRAQLI